ncbi:hypothetical protein K474DRAFT_1214669 [Panus rudis PR-1116 ss-1]|nr:hypothetical protein K474DRAFT_1214669 [Panus rudis PR-1116 ss-1]
MSPFIPLPPFSPRTQPLANAPAIVTHFDVLYMVMDFLTSQEAVRLATTCKAFYPVAMHNGVRDVVLGNNPDKIISFCTLMHSKFSPLLMRSLVVGGIPDPASASCLSWLLQRTFHLVMLDVPIPDDLFWVPHNAEHLIRTIPTLPSLQSLVLRSVDEERTPYILLNMRSSLKSLELYTDGPFDVTKLPLSPATFSLERIVFNRVDCTKDTFMNGVWPNVKSLRVVHFALSCEDAYKAFPNIRAIDMVACTTLMLPVPWMNLDHVRVSYNMNIPQFVHPCRRLDILQEERDCFHHKHSAEYLRDQQLIHGEYGGMEVDIENFVGTPPTDMMLMAGTNMISSGEQEYMADDEGEGDECEGCKGCKMPLPDLSHNLESLCPVVLSQLPINIRLANPSVYWRFDPLQSAWHRLRYVRIVIVNLSTIDELVAWFKSFKPYLWSLGAICIGVRKVKNLNASKKDTVHALVNALLPLIVSSDSPNYFGIDLAPRPHSDPSWCIVNRSEHGVLEGLTYLSDTDSRIVTDVLNNIDERTDIGEESA